MLTLVTIGVVGDLLTAALFWRALRKRQLIRARVERRLNQSRQQ